MARDSTHRLARLAGTAACLCWLAAAPAYAQGGGGGGGGAVGTTTPGQGVPGTNPRGNANRGGSSVGGGAPAGQGGMGQPGTATQGGLNADPTQGQQGPTQGQPETRRGQVEQQQRAAGAGIPATRDQQQLRELNELSRQLTPPGTPVPAPHAEPRSP